ncbi:MAG: TonB-dependent receptor [Acidobacteria bacterium]|nr:TonB-dependent receptor [Acidobacteriota bacterium]
MCWLRLLMVSALCLFAATAPAMAQSSAGTISGTVLDSTGAVVPGAQVTVKNVDTGATRVLTTNERGRYVAPQLMSGNYEVSATTAGFQTEIRRGITLAIGREAVVDFSLSVGAVTETVEVTGEAPLVETTTATTSGLVEEATVRELPLNGRNFTDLMDLSPNVKRLAAARGTSPVMGFGAHFSVAGAHPGQNKYMIDGVNTGDGRQSTPGSAAGNVLGTEAIREFRVLTSNYSAEFGEVSGGIMTAVTKSGTNTLHGSVFEYLRNSALDARQFFDRDPSNPTVRSDPPPFKRNQFGFSLGGPILKDRSFYFGNYEGLRERLGRTSFFRVPTTTTRRLTAGPTVQKILNLYPLPNGQDFGDGTADFVNAPSRATREDYFAIRMDHTFNERFFMFGRYTFNEGKLTDPDSASLFVQTDGNRYQSLTLSFTSMLTPTLLNTFRAGLNRNVTSQQDVTVEGADTSSLVWIPGRGPGNFSVTGMGGLGPSDDSFFWWTSYQFYDDLSYTRGNHSLKFGASVQRNHDNGNRVFNYVGQWQFASISDFLAEKPQQVLSALPEADAIRGFRTWWVGGYFQDDWKVRPNLTLNLGVRLEWLSVPTEVNGKIGVLRDIYTDPVVTAGGPFWELESAFAHISPRVGFAWDPFGNGKTAVRGGFGIFQEAIRNFDFNLPGNRMPPFWNNTVIRSTTANPLVFPLIFPNYERIGIPNVALRLDNLDFHLQQPYKMNWSFNIQREFLPNTLFNIGYVGGRGVNLLNLWSDANSPQEVVTADGRRYIPQGTPRRNPAFSQMRYRNTGHDSYYNSMQLSVIKRASRGIQFSSSYTWSKSIDTSMMKLAGPEFGNTSSENFPHNTKANRGLSAWDQRHYWSTNFGYELPFGPGKALGGDLAGFAGKLLEGWNLSGILTLTSGPPFSAELGFDYASKLPQSGGGGLKPDLVGSDSNPVIDGYRNDPDHYFDVNAFALPPLAPDCAAPGATCTRRMFGNLGRSTLTGPGLATFDLNLMKNTKITEATQLQFRAEFFNLFNRANFALPNSTVFLSLLRRNATAGRITETSTSARQIQFALRLVF